MKKFLLFLTAIFFYTIILSQTKISIDSVASYMGQNVTVCSKVYGVKSLEKVSFINLGARYPNSLLTIVIFSKDKINFRQPLETYNDKTICVTGTIKEYKGKPEIIVSKQEDIVIGK